MSNPLSTSPETAITLETAKAGTKVNWLMIAGLVAAALIVIYFATRKSSNDEPQ